MTFQKSDTKLARHSYEGYINEPKSRSIFGGGGYMSNSSRFPPNNGAVLTIFKIIKAVMLSAAEAELGALFVNMI